MIARKILFFHLEQKPSFKTPLLDPEDGVRNAEVRKRRLKICVFIGSRPSITFSQESTAKEHKVQSSSKQKTSKEHEKTETKEKNQYPGYPILLFFLVRLQAT